MIPPANEVGFVPDARDSWRQALEPISPF